MWGKNQEQVWGGPEKKGWFPRITLVQWEKPGAGALGLKTAGEDEQILQGCMIQAIKDMGSASAQTRLGPGEKRAEALSERERSAHLGR